MNELFFWLTFYGKCINLLRVIFGISLASWLVISFVCVLLLDEKANIPKIVWKWFYVALVVFVVSTVIVSIKPTKKEVITYYVLKQVDNYNDLNETSNFNPDNLIKGVDESITKITDLANNLMDKLENKTKYKIKGDE